MEYTRFANAAGLESLVYKNARSLMRGDKAHEYKWMPCDQGVNEGDSSTGTRISELPILAKFTAVTIWLTEGASKEIHRDHA